MKIMKRKLAVPAEQKNAVRGGPVFGQNGGLAKVDFKFDYAANFSSVACEA